MKIIILGRVGIYLILSLRKSRVLLLIVASMFLLSTILSVNAESVKASRQAPPWTVGYYVKSANTSSWYQVGYDLGQVDWSQYGSADHLFLMDFGTQQKNSSGVWGASFFGSWGSNDTIKNVVTEMARGYYLGTSTDTGSKITIVVGTNNSGSNVNSTAGGVWAQLVKDINSSTSGYSSQVTIVAGNDIEPGWSTVATAKDWLNGYNNTTGRLKMYDYGDAGGCPTSGTYTGTTKCNNGWTVDDIWYKSWGALASYPLPEIYSTTGSNAFQWKSISSYSVSKGNSKLNFIGTLTQYNVCLQVKQKNPNDTSCNGIDNYPTTGWYQLYDALNYTNSTVSQDPLPYSADIRWYPSL